MLILFLVLFFSLSLVEALELKCDSDGSFTIKNARKTSPVFIETKTGEFIDAPGEWVEVKEDKQYNFYGDEGTFIAKEKSKQKIKIGKSTKTVTCPPFTFSCRVFNLSIDYCYTIGGTFQAKYSVYNFDIDGKNTLRFDKPFLLHYDIVFPGQRKYTHAPDALTKEFAELNITMRKLAGLNKFIMKAPIGRDDALSLEIRYEDCTQRKFNLFEWKACVQQPACTINKDCTGDEQCQEKFCQKLVCGDCQYAANNTCFSYECCDHSACAAAAVCTENTCTPLQCSEQQAAREHACVELTCADDEFIEQHQCKKLSCAESEAPHDHACVKLECTGDEQVLNHQCVSLECGLFQRAVEHECVSWGKWIRGKWKSIK